MFTMHSFQGFSLFSNFINSPVIHLSLPCTASIKWNIFSFVDETVSQRPEKKKEASNTGKAKPKKAPENKWIPKNDKQAYSHPWLLTSIKGHTGPILDIDFSSNGKYLASCADGESTFIIFVIMIIIFKHKNISF